MFGCHGKDFWPGDRPFARGLAAVSCSAYNAATVEKRYGLRPEIIYNGVDVELFSPRPVSAALRAQLAGTEKLVVLWVGRQVRWKGAQYLLRALALLRERGYPVKVLLAGDGPYRPDLEGLAHRLGVAEHTLFLGSIPNSQLPDYYALADVVVGTSFANETFGIALCEAAACERPVVASDFGGFREVVQPGETGLLYPPQDAPALAACLEALLQDPARRVALGRAGRRAVVARFSWPCVAERVYRQYQLLLNTTSQT